MEITFIEAFNHWIRECEPGTVIPVPKGFKIPLHFKERSMDQIPGVQFNNPPTIEMEETIKQHVEPFISNIPEGRHGGVFGIITQDDAGNRIANAVVAVKVNDKLEIAGYIAKNWSDSKVIYGVETKFYF